MLGSKPPEAFAARLAKLTRRHRKLMKPGEVFLAACDVFAAGEPYPPPLKTGFRRTPVMVTTDDVRLQREAAARFRLTSVHAALGMQDEVFSDLPPSDNGYLLSHTDRRILIFDGTGKQYKLQAPMKGMWLQPIDHGDGMYTLIFNNGTERVAVATRRESVELTKYFIESFPDRRQKTRVLSVTNDPSIIDF